MGAKLALKVLIDSRPILDFSIMKGQMANGGVWLSAIYLVKTL
jgi:hypothetical protein